MVLTYPAKRCILQHLEANLRFLFAARCPTISRIDKIIPLRIANLSFSFDAISINEICYRFSTARLQVQETAEERLLRQSEALRPGEVLLEVENSPFYSTYIQVTYKAIGNSLNISRSRRLPAKFEDKDEALKEFLRILLRDRLVITVKWLHFDYFAQNVLKIPCDFPKLHVLRIHMQEYDVTRIKKLLDPKSFPLTSIQIYSWREAYNEDPMVTGADCVILVAERFIRDSPEYWYDIILKASNRCVRMWKLEFSMEQILSLMGNLVEKGRDIGSKYVLDCSQLKNLKNVLKKAEERYGGTVVELVEPKKYDTIVTKIISIPFATPTDAEIVVYGIDRETDSEKKKKKENDYNIVINVMKKGSTTPVEKKKNIWDYMIQLKSPWIIYILFFLCLPVIFGLFLNYYWI